MSELNNAGLYDEICSETSTWVIRYYSSKYKNSIFLIWYTDTDENSTDKLLTLKTGEMLAVSSLANLNEQITKHLDLLSSSEKLPEWLEKTKNLTLYENATYNTILLSNSLESNNLEPQIFEELTNFRNLFGDYVRQNENNSHLEFLLENEFVQLVWDYYYNYIFWPQFENREVERPQLILDMKKLRLGVSRMIKMFDKKIKLI